MPVQTWESFAYLASRIKDWKHDDRHKRLKNLRFEPSAEIGPWFVCPQQ